LQNSIWKFAFVSASRRNLPSLLRRIVFVGEAALGAGFDFEGVRLGAMSSGNQGVMRTINRMNVVCCTISQ
jgi:hypothetical protein